MNKKKSLKAGSRSGSVLVLVMCLMAGMTVLCLGILLAAYSLNRRIHLREEGEIAGMLAESAEQRFSEELTGPTYEGRPKDPRTSIFAYVGYWILDPEEGWPADNRENEKSETGGETNPAVRRFRMGPEGWPEEAGDMEISLRWTMEEGDSFADMPIHLIMEITCCYGERRSTVTKIFEKTVVDEVSASEGSPSEAGRTGDGNTSCLATGSEASRLNADDDGPAGQSQEGKEEEESGQDWKEEGCRIPWKWAEAGNEEDNEK